MTNEEALRMAYSKRKDSAGEERNFLNTIIKALEQDQWIPVSERYPEEEGEEYLVCYDDGTIRIRNLYFTVVDNEPYFEYGQGIVAWMPLPTSPYKASPTWAEGSEE